MRSMTIEPSDNGGHTIMTNWKDKEMAGKHGMRYSMQEPHKAVFAAGEHKQMMKHIASHLDIKTPTHQDEVAAGKGEGYDEASNLE